MCMHSGLPSSAKLPSGELESSSSITSCAPVASWSRVALQHACCWLSANSHACKTTDLGQASWLPQRLYILLLIPYMVMQLRCRLPPKACCRGCASRCRPSLPHTRRGSSSASHEHSSVACETTSVHQLASKLRTDGASGLICNATCALAAHSQHTHQEAFLDRIAVFIDGWPHLQRVHHSALLEAMLLRLPRLLQHAAGRWILLMHA